MKLQGKTIVLGVTGGIAAYKSADVVSRLKKQGADVYVIMTQNSTQFISALTFQSLSQNYVVTDMFEDPKTWDVEHIALAKRADLFLIAPASANVIGKIAHGIADDMLTTTVMATEAPVYLAVAMNTKMYENPILQNNLATLKSYGYHIIDPGSGRLACGDVGAGKLAEPERIVNEVIAYFEKEALNLAPKALAGKRLLITAGPTRESIDPVRYISNESSGKMGYAIAKVALEMGADVTLVSGPTSIKAPEGVRLIPVVSTQEMFDAVMDNKEVDVIIKAAAPADYRPAQMSLEKIKKKDSSMQIEMVKNPDILKTLGEIKTNQLLVGFAAETQNLKAYALGKLNEKNLDFIVANNVAEKGAGFDGDTNIVTIYDRNGTETAYDCLEKEQVAKIVLDRVVQKLSV
ncbi:bifunctional phosphopantothenoylcysteine decarboxylase/phosphopantothenate--cysteine ligase CoaBC [Fusibacter ferrireducens]|uniref:Coenzyme A biosynthesis bifunctional protein CoaBC n=1 Tax=Fusibacter ferrireducens TaxID=2785058 RepID=A0ABR9ZNF9_9FIRM|nr:bifunctional phosphopantothenoylcysteine decarboxylase/phosphopantothenate--cysteine ligase CoaBC [Fusibacter ferrireducens]MBF4691668.1 bifunctional phosphopantothenoylcysteine decarboxylase/phosphopantothenate--cysteine ligase CoaBC [Fusibacter ferrireducens]